MFVSSCSDLTVDGEPWYDRDGVTYTCAWYGRTDSCEEFGNHLENFGLVANEVCCVCGGGANPLSTSPTSSPSLENHSSEVDPVKVIFAVLSAILFLWLVIGYMKRRIPNNNAAESTNLRTRPAQNTPQQAQHAATNLRTRPTQNTSQQVQHAPSIVVDEREVRREFILTNIIYKKVVTKSSQSNYGTKESSKESAIMGISQDNNQVDEIDEGEVILPHEAAIRERSQHAASMILTLHDGIGDEEQGSVINHKKDDICIETLRSIRSEMNIHFDMESIHESSLYSPRSCPICCEDYVKGDDVAWSKNEDCCHAYHTDCIVPWLMDHDDCPMCRCVYVVTEGRGE